MADERMHQTFYHIVNTLYPNKCKINYFFALRLHFLLLNDTSFAAKKEFETFFPVSVEMKIYFQSAFGINYERRMTKLRRAR